MKKVISLLLMCFCGLAFGQGYPSRPIKLVIGFPPGGPSDIFGRAFAAALSANLGQPVVVENKAGAGGVVGMDIVAKSAPDGYTLGLNNQGAVAMAPYAMSKMPFNPNKDLALVTTVVKVPERLLYSSICRWPMPPVPEDEYE